MSIRPQFFACALGAAVLSYSAPAAVTVESIEQEFTFAFDWVSPSGSGSQVETFTLDATGGAHNSAFSRFNWEGGLFPKFSHGVITSEVAVDGPENVIALNSLLTLQHSGNFTNYFSSLDAVIRVETVMLFEITDNSRVTLLYGGGGGNGSPHAGGSLAHGGTFHTIADDGDLLPVVWENGSPVPGRYRLTDFVRLTLPPTLGEDWTTAVSPAFMYLQRIPAPSSLGSLALFGIVARRRRTTH